MKQVPVDLHRERKKLRTALLSLALIVCPGGLFILDFPEGKPDLGFESPEPPDLLPPQIYYPPLAEAPPPEPEPPAPPKPAPKPTPTPSEAELALKRIQVSLAAEKERREEEERKQREEEEQRKAEEERKQKEEEKKKREEEERKEREREEQRKAEEERRTAEEEQRKEEERKRREEEVELARRKAEELRAQADAAARAAEAARLAGLRDIYIGRLENRIGNETDTPAELEGRDDVVVRVEIFLHPDGELKGWPKVIRSSGYPDYDNEAVRAIIQVAPLVIPNADEEPELAREFLYLKLDISPGKERQFWQ